MKCFKLIAEGYKCPVGTIFIHPDDLSVEDWKLAQGGYLGRSDSGVWSFLPSRIENNKDFEQI